MCHVNRGSLTHCSQGSVAQLVEQRTSNPKVVGSDATLATELFSNLVGHYQCRLPSLMSTTGKSDCVSMMMRPVSTVDADGWTHATHMNIVMQ